MMRAPQPASRMTMDNTMARAFPLFSVMVLALIFSSLPKVSADTALPRVELTSDNIGPRHMEDLTGKSVPRDYALAWQSLAQALEENRRELLNGYFTGFAKEKFTQKIADQRKNGLHLKYEDRGHKLTGLFYSPAGDAMQLRDDAVLQIKVVDGDKVIQTEQLTLHYMVLMTPGADRWLVRDLETIPEGKP
jgi:hypothetical protein